MRTVVYQSYRTHDVPGWISRCIESVRNWAALKGFDYEFIDDRLFDYVPDWYKERTNGNILLISDLARLELAKEFLENGYDRTIWVDADVIVCDPDDFDIKTADNFLFCREIWVDKPRRKPLTVHYRVNNAVTVFIRDNNFLKFYICACKSYVLNKIGKIDQIDVGTRFLTSLHEQAFFPLLTNVGLLGPIVLEGLTANKPEYVEMYMKAFANPVYAANLCSSYRNAVSRSFAVDDGVFDRAVDMLLETKGDALNRYLNPPTECESLFSRLRSRFR